MRPTLGVFALVTMLGVSAPAMAAGQVPTEPQTRTGDLQNDRDDGFDAGWLGLLGLAGLFGLRRSDRRHHPLERSDATMSTR
jgi:MYXO-CTERM domain-containing protein